MTGEQGAKDPDDLDFTDDERVVQIDEDRYVVSSDGSPQQPDVDSHPRTEPAEEVDDRPPDAVTQAQVSRWLAASFKDTGFTYGFDATLSTPNDVVRHRLVSNDLPTTFETLVTWFVKNSTTDTTVEEAFGILLTASDMSIKLPPGSLRRLVHAHDLDPSDSIADLLAAVDEEGVEFPPRSD